MHHREAGDKGVTRVRDLLLAILQIVRQARKARLPSKSLAHPSVGCRHFDGPTAARPNSQMGQVGRLVPELSFGKADRKSRLQSVFNDVQRRIRGFTARSIPDGRREASAQAFRTAR